MAFIDTLTTVEQLAQSCGGAECAAELHGIVTGFICAGGDPESEAVEGLIDVLLAGAAANEAAVVNRVVDLSYAIRDELDGDDLSFTALLPDDTEPLDERIAALARWCGGLLSGFGLGLSGGERLSDLGRELVEDLEEIANVDATVEDLEVDERNFLEVAEYVRVAALTLRAEFTGGGAKSDDME